jgi:hypothetical protein
MRKPFGFMPSAVLDQGGELSGGGAELHGKLLKLRPVKMLITHASVKAFADINSTKDSLGKFNRHG